MKKALVEPRRLARRPSRLTSIAAPLSHSASRTLGCRSSPRRTRSARASAARACAGRGTRSRGATASGTRAPSAAARRRCQELRSDERGLGPRLANSTRRVDPVAGTHASAFRSSTQRLRRPVEARVPAAPTPRFGCSTTDVLGKRRGRSRASRRSSRGRRRPSRAGDAREAALEPRHRVVRRRRRPRRRSSCAAVPPT